MEPIMARDPMKTYSIVVLALLVVVVSASAEARPATQTPQLTSLAHQVAEQSQNRGFSPQQTKLGLMWVGTGAWQDAPVLGLVAADTDGSYIIYQYNKNTNGQYRNSGYYVSGTVHGRDLTGEYFDPSHNIIDSLDGGYFTDGAWSGYWYFTWKSSNIFTYGQYLPLENS